MRKGLEKYLEWKPLDPTERGKMFKMFTDGELQYYPYKHRLMLIVAPAQPADHENGVEAQPASKRLVKPGMFVARNELGTNVYFDYEMDEKFPIDENYVSDQKIIEEKRLANILAERNAVTEAKARLEADLKELEELRKFKAENDSKNNRRRRSPKKNKENKNESDSASIESEKSE